MATIAAVPRRPFDGVAEERLVREFVDATPMQFGLKGLERDEYVVSRLLHLRRNAMGEVDVAIIDVLLFLARQLTSVIQ